ncbi:hypothetical protein K7432_004743 [Basidiobolus ranarum]|uniref:Uncharacterized protein n=1 Tax=Basidiobolus ranarum TaxID=34480 RepID=A0ABR2WXM0_9FUNG
MKIHAQSVSCNPRCGPSFTHWRSTCIKLSHWRNLKSRLRDYKYNKLNCETSIHATHRVYTPHTPRTSHIPHTSFVHSKTGSTIYPTKSSNVFYHPSATTKTAYSAKSNRIERLKEKHSNSSSISNLLPNPVRVPKKSKVKPKSTSTVTETSTIYSVTSTKSTSYYETSSTSISSKLRSTSPSEDLTSTSSVQYPLSTFSSFSSKNIATSTFQTSSLPSSPPVERPEGASNTNYVSGSAPTNAVQSNSDDTRTVPHNVVVATVTGSVFGVVAVCIGLFTLYRQKRKRRLTTEINDREMDSKKEEENEEISGVSQMDPLISGSIPILTPLSDSSYQKKNRKSFNHQSIRASAHSMSAPDRDPRSLSLNSFDDTLAKFPQPADITSWNFYTIPTLRTSSEAAENVPHGSGEATTRNTVVEMMANELPVMVPVMKKALLVDIQDLKRERSLRRADSNRVHRSTLNGVTRRYSSTLQIDLHNTQLQRSKSDRVVGQRWRNSTKRGDTRLYFEASHELLPPFTSLATNVSHTQTGNLMTDKRENSHHRISTLESPETSQKRYSTLGQNCELPEFGPIERNK